MKFELLPVDEKGKFDELVEEQGVRVLIDPGALMHVIGTKMDFVQDRLKYASTQILHVSNAMLCTEYFLTCWQYYEGKLALCDYRLATEHAPFRVN